MIGHADYCQYSSVVFFILVMNIVNNALTGCMLKNAFSRDNVCSLMNVPI